MKMKFVTAAKVGVLAFSAFALQSQAAVVSRLFDGNDCAGYFGDNFSSCTIFVNDAGTRIELSPVIAKFEYEDGTPDGFEVNSGLFPSVDGTEFTLTENDPAFKTGNWEYDRGLDDPGVRYWATKAGTEFLLSWDVDAAATALGGVCDVSDVYVLACLDAANVVTSADWATPTAENKALSHITFYDTDDGSGPPGEIPVPAAAWLFGSALLGLFGVARRKRA